MPTEIYAHDTFYFVVFPSPSGPVLSVIAVAAIAGFIWFFLFWYRQRRP